MVTDCRFVTDRLEVDEWHVLAAARGHDLVTVLSQILTEASTQALPPEWQGSYTLDRVHGWVGDRDRESPTSLVVDRHRGTPLGLLILYVSPGHEGVDLRVGYLFGEQYWGQGYASEVVAGLVQWATLQHGVRTLTAGVSTTNLASARVLEKSGFRRVDATEQELLYRRNLGENSV